MRLARATHCWIVLVRPVRPETRIRRLRELLVTRMWKLWWITPRLAKVNAIGGRVIISSCCKTRTFRTACLKHSDKNLSTTRALQHVRGVAQNTTLQERSKKCTHQKTGCSQQMQ